MESLPTSRLSRPRITVRRLMGLVLVMAPVMLLARAVDRAREDARQAQCSGHLKQLAVAMHFYLDAHGSFPPGTVPNPAIDPGRRLGWVVALRPHADFGTVLTLDPTKGWDEPPNWPVTLSAPPGVTFVGMTPADVMRNVVCPDNRAARGGARPYPLGYVGIAGVGPDAPTLPAGHHRAGVFGYDRVTKPADITDGTSRTMLLAETGVGHAPWTAGGPSSVRGVDPATRPYLGRGRPFGGYHPGGANVAMADGSVRFVREAIDPRVFEALATIAGGEVLPDGW